MAQLTVYVDDDTLRRIGHAAEREKCSVSRWVKSRLAASLDQTWPPKYFEVFGSLADSDLDRPKQPSWSNDAQRECL